MGGNYALRGGSLWWSLGVQASIGQPPHPAAFPPPPSRPLSGGGRPGSLLETLSSICECFILVGEMQELEEEGRGSSKVHSDEKWGAVGVASGRGMETHCNCQ